MTLGCLGVYMTLTPFVTRRRAETERRRGGKRGAEAQSGSGQSVGGQQRLAGSRLEKVHAARCVVVVVHSYCFWEGGKRQLIWSIDFLKG